MLIDSKLQNNTLFKSFTAAPCGLLLLCIIKTQHVTHTVQQVVGWNCSLFFFFSDLKLISFNQNAELGFTLFLEMHLSSAEHGVV